MSNPADRAAELRRLLEHHGRLYYVVDQPEIDPKGLRVAGPFEVTSIGRYSIEDWKGYLVGAPSGGYGEPAKLQNYIDVICKLYRKDAGIQGASGLLHAVADTGKERIGSCGICDISFHMCRRRPTRASMSMQVVRG